MSEPLFFKMSNYNSPAIVEVQGKEWISYGADNNYFGYLLDRYRGSATNHAIINGVSDQIVGDGINQDLELFPYDDLHKFAFDLKCYGWYIQVIILSDDLTTIERIDHSPVQNWRSGKANSAGVITEYFYSDNWTQTNKKQFIPKAYPVYNSNLNVYTSVLPVKPYRSGSFYYPTVDYQGGLQYAHIEEEISNFHINNIKNGFAPGMIVNFNNGDPGQESRDAITRDIKKNLQGSSKAGSVIVAFNDDKDKAATIDTVDISDLDKQYQFLSEEATKKIMVSHRVTSPFFFGIRDSGGFGSNADEIKNSWLLWERTVLNPFRKIMLDNINYIQDEIDQPVTGLDFIPLTPIEFTDNVTQPEPQQMTSQAETNLMDWIVQTGETVNGDDWILIDESPVNYDTEDQQDALLTGFNLASVVSGDSRKKSEQDTSLFRVRYVYAPSTVGGDSREFCRKMVKAAKVYRKEDLQAASDKSVNKGWGPHGADTYDIWLYKGGGSCHHFWQRQTYLRKNNKRISVNEAKKMLNKLPPGEKRDAARVQVNSPKVAKRPTDMKNRGFLPSNKKNWN